MALIATDDQTTVAAVLETIATSGLPTVLMLGGPGRTAPPAPWRTVGELNFMCRALTEIEPADDDRVRRARSRDVDAVRAVFTDALHMSVDAAAVIADLVQNDSSDTAVYLLEEGGLVASAVVTTIVDDFVCVWSLGTRPPFRRRGYGRALIEDSLQRAAHVGVHTGLLSSTPSGRELYVATGWATLESWEMLLYQEPTDARP
jgi:GNAT superfamily N-acetyltransferase